MERSDPTSGPRRYVQDGQPSGQLAPAKHAGGWAGPALFTRQHCDPAAQVGEHVGATQLRRHIDVGAAHWIPQPPQLSGSFASLTHTPLQQANPSA